MLNLIIRSAVVLLLAGTSALHAAQPPQCDAGNPLVQQNNRIIWQVPVFSGPVKSVSSESVPEPSSSRSEKFSGKADFSPCGEITYFETRNRGRSGRMIVTSVLSGSETRDTARYSFRVYRHLPGKKDRFPMTISTEFTKDAQQQVTGGKGKMYIEGNETAIHGDIQVQRKDGKLTAFTLSWPDIYLTLNYKVGYDDAGRVSSLTSAMPDGSGNSVTYYTYTREGYPATKEVRDSVSRTLTECISRDSYSNCTQVRVSKYNGDKKTTEMLINNNIVYYP